MLFRSKEAADWETKRDAAQQTALKAGEEYAAARKLLSEIEAKRSDLTREQARLEAQVLQLKKEKDTLEAAIGKLEAQGAAVAPVTKP